MNTLKKTLTKALVAIIALILMGCTTPVMLDPKGSIGAAEIGLIYDSLMLMSIVVIPVIVMTIIFAVRYRESNKKAVYSPNWYHSNVVEIFVWGVPILIILVLGMITWRTTHALDPFKPIQANKKPIEIQVVSLDWKWLFIYPEQNIATVNFVEFPVDAPLDFKLTSDAPMNGFQIDQLGTQVYTMAGMQTQVHLIANESGEFAGRSTNYSGHGFSGMTFVAKAVSDEEFTAWVNKVKHANNSLDSGVYANLTKPSYNNPVTLYSSVQKHLFHNIIMKFMQPNHNNASATYSMQM